MQNKSAKSVISRWEEKLSGFICLPGGPLGITLRPDRLMNSDYIIMNQMLGSICYDWIKLHSKQFWIIMPGEIQHKDVMAIESETKYSNILEGGYTF